MRAPGTAAQVSVNRLSTADTVTADGVASGDASILGNNPYTHSFIVESIWQTGQGKDILKQRTTDALFAGKSGVIEGRLNKAMAFSSRLLPRHAAARASMPETEKVRG